MSVPADVLVEDVSTDSGQCGEHIDEWELHNDRTIKSFYLLFRNLLCAHSFHLGLSRRPLSSLIPPGTGSDLGRLKRRDLLALSLLSL